MAALIAAEEDPVVIKEEPSESTRTAVALLFDIPDEVPPRRPPAEDATCAVISLQFEAALREGERNITDSPFPPLAVPH